MSSPKEPSRYIALDGVRGVAAVCVALFHVTLAHGDWLPGAYVAVDIFFCLSGFVLAGAYRPALEAGLAAGAFLKMRLVRLYPVYALGLALGLLAHALALGLGAPVTGGRAAALMALDGLLMLPSLAANQSGYATYYIVNAPFPFNPPSWSLFFELLANAGLACFRPRGKQLAAFLVLSGAAFVGSTLALGHPSGWGVVTFWGGAPRAVFEFYLGYGVRELADAGRLPRWRLSGLGPAAVALAALAPPGPGLGAYFLLAIVVAPAILCVSLTDPASSAARALCREAGRLSYPLYALHWPAMKLFVIAAVAVTGEENFTPGPALVLAFVAALAAASWALAVFVEPWLRRALARLLPIGAAVSPSPSPA